MPVRILVILMYCSMVSFGQEAAKPEPIRCRALLIGNARYNNVSAVESAVPDVDLVASKLREVGCREQSIEVQRNLQIEEMRQAIEDRFFPSIQPGEIAVFYFAGHAVQADQENYLLGVDFNPHTKDEMRDAAYLLNRFSKRVEDHKPALFLMLLDAAYDDQVLAAIPNYVPGLAEYPSSILNGIVIYSTAKDHPVSHAPGDGPSVFAQALAMQMLRPGQTVTELASEIHRFVDSETSGAQRPYLLLGYTGRFRFVAPPPEVAKVEVKTQVVSRRQHQDDREYYVLIPAGKFKMGCVPGPAECEANEKPQHTVEITHPFWMGENEVRVVSYRRWTTFTHQKMHRAPPGFEDWKNDSLPISMVPWEKANEYCGWVGGRLPTEAEWEYAARAGNDQPYPMSDFSKAREAANFKGRSEKDPYDFVAPVQQFNKNDWSLYDLSGNVWEWVADWYSPTIYQELSSQPVLKDPAGPSTGKEKVIRGGSFDSDPLKHLRLSYREKSGGAQNKIGFRCVLPDTSETRAKFR